MNRNARLGARRRKGQLTRMQQMASRWQIGGRGHGLPHEEAHELPFVLAVEQVANDRVPDVRKVHTQLVSPTRARRGAHQCASPFVCEHRHPSDRWAAFVLHRRLAWHTTVQGITDRRLDVELRAIGMPFDHGEVLLLDRVGAKQEIEVARGLPIAREQQAATRETIEAMRGRCPEP